MTEPQPRVQRLLDDLTAGGRETGLQLTAYLDGERVIDAWSGLADPATGRPVDGDTLFTVFSVSKGITATALHILAERGAIADDDPIARHWPQFARHGKEGILVRHALSHTAGVPQMPAGMPIAAFLDWPGMGERITDLTPLWPPGETLAYHAMTFGWIVGGVAERADGRPFARIVAEEIAGPLGLDGLYFGVPDDALDRVATLEATPELLALPQSRIPNVVPDGAIAAETMNSAPVRRACLPGYGMIANARSLARVYAALIGAGVDGIRLVSPERMRAATTLQVDAIDAGSGERGCFALGYGLGGPDSAAGPRRSAFGHSGYGGAHAFADPDCGLAAALTKNRLVAHDRGTGTTWEIFQEVRAALGIPNAL